jgi:homeobox protein cut-like
MERKVESLELELKAERAGREATQAHLLEADEGAGEREAAWEAQRRILVDDAERLRVTLHEATRERDALRLRVAAVEGGTPADRAGPTPPPSGSISVSDMLLERKAYEAEVCHFILLSSYVSFCNSANEVSSFLNFVGERALAYSKLAP